MNATTTGCPVHAGFDPLSEEFLRDPYAVLPEVADAPVFYAPSLDYYVVTRYADIERVFLDPETFSAANAQLPLITAAARGGQDAARRRPQAAAVDGEPRPARPRPAAQARRPRLHAATGHRDGAAHPRDRRRAARRRRRVTAVRSHRGAGVPAADADHVQLHGRAGGRTGRSSRSGAAAVRAWPGAGRRPRRRCTTRSRWCSTAATCASWSPPRPTDRADDFASALLEIHDEDPDALAQEDIASILFSLSFAGHETTNNLIGNCVRRLLEVPERWDRLVDAPGPDPRRGRRDPALRPVGAGVAARDHAAGERSAASTCPRGRSSSSGSRPPAATPRSSPTRTRFDPERPNSRRTLAFGRGIHFCIGSALGRLEATLALEELTRRFPGLRLAPPDQEIPFHPNISFRGPQTLAVQA